MNKKNKRKMIFANKIHREIFLLILMASLLPSLIITFSLYYLIFGVTATQFAFPEAIAYNIIPAARKVRMILLASFPTSILLILTLAYKITHRIIGPFDRIIRELDECIEGKKERHIRVRKTDKFWPLVDKINKLLDKCKK
ncbi:MAG: hypothetical protein KJ957_04115 [Candidatus Omnitrophica bacterium]|nr:hypothetical protein [Candidatus Omnitrophota bacterium]